MMSPAARDPHPAANAAAHETQTGYQRQAAYPARLGNTRINQPPTAACPSAGRTKPGALDHLLLPHSTRQKTSPLSPAPSARTRICSPGADFKFILALSARAFSKPPAGPPTSAHFAPFTRSTRQLMICSAPVEHRISALLCFRFPVHQRSPLAPGQSHHRRPSSRMRLATSPACRHRSQTPASPVRGRSWPSGRLHQTEAAGKIRPW